MSTSAQHIIIKQLYQELEQIQAERQLSLPRFLISLSDSTTTWGSWQPVTRTIQISNKLIQQFDWFIVIEVLKHELAHAYVDHHFPNNSDQAHGASFQQACQIIGVDDWARKASINPETLRECFDSQTGKTPTVIRRIQKLLALSDSSNEYEAAEAMRKVQDLCEKHHIQSIETAQDDNLDLVIDLGYKRLPQYVHQITSILTNFYHIQVVQAPTWNAKHFQTHQGLHLLGSHFNVTMGEYVFWFLWNQLPILWEQHRRHHPNTSAAARKSFYQGLLSGFYKKLDHEHLSQTSHDKHQQSLIQLGETRIQHYVQARFPRLRRVSSRARSSYAACFRAGEDIGKNLQIRGGLNPRQHSHQNRKLRLNPFIKR